MIPYLTKLILIKKLTKYNRNLKKLLLSLINRNHNFLTVFNHVIVMIKDDQTTTKNQDEMQYLITFYTKPLQYGTIR